MQLPLLRVIDISRFPTALIQGARLVPGDGPRIIEDLEALVQHGKAFVLVIVNGADHPQRQHEEAKARMLWLKENRTRLAIVCKGIVSVMPDSLGVALAEKQAAGLQAALGIRFVIAKNTLSAEREANELLNAEALDSSD